MFVIKKIYCPVCQHDLVYSDNQITSVSVTCNNCGNGVTIYIVTKDNAKFDSFETKELA